MPRGSSTRTGAAPAFSQGLLLAALFCLPFSTVWIISTTHATIAGSLNVFAEPKLFASELLSLLAAAVWFIVHRPGWRVIRPFAWLVAVVAWAALSAWWAPYPVLALSGAVHLAIAWLWLVALSNEFRDGRFARRAALVFMISAGLQAVWGVAQFILQHDLGFGKVFGESLLSPDTTNVAKIVAGGHREIRAYGSLPHPNILAAYLAAGLFVIGTRVWWPDPARRVARDVATVGLLVLLGAGLITTFSRTILIVTAVNAVLVMIFSYRRWHRLPAAAVAGAVVTVIVGLLLSQPLVSRTAVNTPGETGVTNRVIGYEAAGRMIAAQPYGVGMGNFVLAIDRTKPGLPDYQHQPAHNVLFLIAAELGIIPALLVLAFVIQLGCRFHFVRPAGLRENSINFSIFMLGGVFIAAGMIDHFWWSSVPGLLLLVSFAALVESRIPLLPEV